MQKLAITTGWSYRVILKCILTCYSPRRPPVTNKVTFPLGVKLQMEDFIVMIKNYQFFIFILNFIHWGINLNNEIKSNKLNPNLDILIKSF